MTGFPDEIRFGITTALTAFIFASAFRFARRMTGRDWIACALDAFLILFAVEYLAVAIPGTLGLLSPVSMYLSALALSAPMWIPLKSAPLTPEGDSGLETLVSVSCLLFVLGFTGGIVWIGRYSPVLGDDALTYHLPAAVQWLREGHIGLYSIWFFNPANTYSPLAGSTFMAWLIGPMRNDLLVRWVQAPALVMIFFALIELCRAIGVRTSVAAIIATGAVLSRPFVSQAFEVKDDLFLAAFFLAAVVGCDRARLSDKLGPWRVGIALGLFFATKYTAILTAPLFLLLIDAPTRAKWRWKCWLIAIGVMLSLCAPWYARNSILTGNPLYPIPVEKGDIHLFSGLFVTERSTEMRSLAGIWTSLTGKFHSVSGILLGLLALGWLVASVRTPRSMLRDPMIRICTIGSLLGVLIFVVASHAAEIRYMYPALLLMFACCGIAVSNRSRVGARLVSPNPAPDAKRATQASPLPGGVLDYATPKPASPMRFPIALSLSLALTVLCIAGAFVDHELLAFLIVCGVGAGIVGSLISFAQPKHRLATAAFSLLLLCALVYVYWPAYLKRVRADYSLTNARIHGDAGALWEWVNQNIPPEATIAYTNAFMIHAMGGFDHTRTLAYAPTRPGLRFYHDLPPSHAMVSDQQIRGFVADALTKDADREAWLANLRRIRPQYLLVGRQDVLRDPPEQKFAADNPRQFERVFENPAGIIYRVSID